MVDSRVRVLFPSLAEFAKEKGWRCGSSFISWRSKCYRDPVSGEKRFQRVVNPKTGKTRKEPVGLTYKEYQKERSQALKKRGKGGALSDREQRHLGDIEKLAAKTRKDKQRRVEAREKRLPPSTKLPTPNTTGINEWKRHVQGTIKDKTKDKFEAAKGIIQREKSLREGLGVVLNRKNAVGEKISEDYWNAAKNSVLKDRAVISGIADKYPNMRSDPTNYMGNETKRAINYAEGNDLDTLVSYTSWKDRPRRGYDEALEDAKKRKAKAEAGKQLQQQTQAKSPTPEIKLSDVKNSNDRLKYAEQELTLAKQSGDRKRVADWEAEAKRVRKTRLKEDQKRQKEKQASLFDPLAYDSDSPLLRTLYSAEISVTQFNVLYPSLVEFRSGYECGGTFIPASRKCWTDPKSGARLKVPFSYKEYTKQRSQAWKKAQSGAVLDENDRQLIASTERLQRKITGKKEKAELTRAAVAAGAKQILPSGIAEVDPTKIAVDPQRFQYKILGAQTKSGSVGSLSGVRKWDANLAGIIQTWRDPKNGRVYVINGHNRLDLAKQLNVPKVTARFIKAQSPEEARAVGAMTNIAEGRGTPIDAAKFFRDSGLSKQDLDRKGIPMREKIATDGLALSKLSEPLFNRVVQGELPEQRAVTIGAVLSDHKQQDELVKLVDQREKRGKRIDNDTIHELSQMVADAPQKKESQGGLFDLLGFTPETRSLAIEKAQIQAGIKKQLARERKLFGTVGKSRAASELEKAGNKINVEESAEISDTAAKALEAFDKEKGLSGRVSNALNRAAERLADGESSAKIQKEAYDEILTELQETYRFGKRQGTRRTENIAERRKTNQGDLFAASKAPFPVAEFGGEGMCTCQAPPLKRRRRPLKRRRYRHGA